MTQLSIDDFRSFFAAVNAGREPFPWQARLAEEAAARMADGHSDILPDLLDVPTGAGKTSVIDVVTFLQALESAQPPAQRVVPRRTVFVVDRRVVVDQVDEHVRRLAAQLRERVAEDGVVGEVARALKALHGSDREPPVKTGTLRGGIERDESWARRPDVPAVITSTVDQVGSRLLFRGYGVSDSAKPIQAGLLGADTLIVLDEVHLSTPFAETLRMLGERYIDAGEVAIPRRWLVMELSATPHSKSTRRVFTLGPDDRDPKMAPSLSSRLAARKPTRLVEVSITEHDDAKFARTVTQLVQQVMAGGDHKRVLVVCNRVSRAAECAQSIAQAAEDEKPRELRDAQVELLTGRMRAVERDAVLYRVVPLVAAGAPEPQHPIILVSTQSIEVGADFDFDALITECASLDALRQRFGRVDRLGSCADRGIEPQGVVIARRSEVKSNASDPIYGTSLGATWRALAACATATGKKGERWIDFGAGFPQHLVGDPALLPDRGHAPFLFPQHLDAWSHTSPIPDPDPDPALWLHGLEPSDPDVAIVWRADVTAERLARADEDDVALASLVDAVTAIPPGPSETLSLPVSHVRAWLDRPDAPLTVADADAETLPKADNAPELNRQVLIWRGGSSSVSGAARIRPGDVIVVPADYGGIGALGTWDPRSTLPVVDEAEVDQVGPMRRRPVLRVNSEVLGLPVPHLVDGESTTETRLRVREFLDSAAASAAAGDWPDARLTTIEYLRRPSARVRVTRDDDGWIVASATRAAGDAGGGDSASFVGASSEGSSFAAVRVSLEEHTRGVADMARTLARNCGLPPAVADDLALAAALHDVGKLDPRFQAMLAYPDPAPVEPLGKSRHGNDRRLRDRARAMSGLPDRFDHAVAGLAILKAHPDMLDAAHDPDLVQHLISSHHGQCRPFARPIVGSHAVPINAVWKGTVIDLPAGPSKPEFDPAVGERFVDLVRRYGWYGVAHLEAIMRLADWYQSEQEQLAGGV